VSEPRNFIDKHFGAIITAVVSLSAVLVSAAQIWVATINKEKELAVARTTAEEARNLKELTSSRSWKVDLAKFMAENRTAIFSEGEDGRQLQKVMLATFPPEITYSVFGSLSDISGDKTNTYWADAERSAAKLYYPRVKIYYAKAFPREIIDVIGDTLAEGDIAYDYYDQEIPKGLTNGDVRYFHADDQELAYQVKRDFEELACFSGYGLRVGVIPLIRSNKRAPKGTVEIWLPGKAIHGNTVEEQC